MHIYSYNENGSEHYYEFRTNKGVLLVTADGKKDRGHVTRVSMTYNKANRCTASIFYSNRYIIY